MFQWNLIRLYMYVQCYRHNGGKRKGSRGLGLRGRILALAWVECSLAASCHHCVAYSGVAVIIPSLLSSVVSRKVNRSGFWE